MKIEFTGRQTEIPREVRRLAERKLAKVAKVLPGLTRAHVILTADKHRQIAEVSAHSRNLDLTAVEESTNPRLSVSNAMDKLLRQAQRQQQKRRERRGPSTARRPSAPPPTGARPDEDDAEAPRIIRNRRRAVKPMTLDEATLELESRAEGVLVFRDAKTERMRILYRREDGNLGLIEPEA
ncbi:MAG: ribosome-associated translation inhibitor RaiA [Acidobacteria bacterium]|jgi:putative sigma-54 modulation protein|nr:ribosome-associated translation inhibitor RaiA [Acidobacteriota bacterium]